MKKEMPKGKAPFFVSLVMIFQSGVGFACLFINGSGKVYLVVVIVQTFVLTVV